MDRWPVDVDPDLICGACGSGLVSGTAARCPRCGTLYHKGCWATADACSRPGCGPPLHVSGVAERSGGAAVRSGPVAGRRPRWHLAPCQPAQSAAPSAAAPVRAGATGPVTRQSEPGGGVATATATVAGEAATAPRGGRVTAGSPRPEVHTPVEPVPAAGHGSWANEAMHPDRGPDGGPVPRSGVEADTSEPRAHSEVEAVADVDGRPTVEAGSDRGGSQTVEADSDREGSEGASGGEPAPAAEPAPGGEPAAGAAESAPPAGAGRAPGRMSIDELEARVRRPRPEEVPPGARAGDGAPGRRRRARLLAGAALVVVALIALAVLGTRGNWFAPVTGRVHTGEEIDRARSDGVEQGRRAGIEEGRREGRRQGVEQGRVEGCRTVFDRAGSSTLMSGPGPRASIVRRQDCGRP